MENVPDKMDLEDISSVTQEFYIDAGVNGKREKASSPNLNGKRVRKKNPKYIDNKSNSILTKRKKGTTRKGSAKRAKIEKGSESQIKLLSERKRELETQLEIVNQDLAIINQKLEEKRMEMLGSSLPNGIISTGIVSSTVESTETIDKYDDPTDDEDDSVPQSSTSTPALTAAPSKAVPTSTPKTIKPKTNSKSKGSGTTKTPKKTPTKRKSSTTKLTETPVHSKSVAIDSCKRVLRNLISHRLAFPFNQPVDPVLLNIPDYPQIIKHPMDFGTIKAKLDANEYPEVSAFVSDVNLVFNNAFTYNQPKSDVYTMAETLRDLFRKRIKPIEDRERKREAQLQQSEATPQEAAPAPTTTPKIKSPVRNSPSPGIEKPKSPPQNANFQELNKSVHLISQQLSKFIEQQQQPSRKPKKEPLESIPMTKEEKRRLSVNINSLTGANLAMVVKIIKSQMPNLGNGKEIEIDIDALDTATLRALESHVNSVKRKRPKRRPKRAPPSQGPTGTEDSQASRIELAKITELGTQSKIQDVERRLQELSQKNATLNRSAPSVPTKSFEQEIEEQKQQTKEETELSSESESESDSSSDSGSDSESGSSSSDSDSGSESDSDSDSEDSDDEKKKADAAPAKVSQVETVIAPTFSKLPAKPVEDAPQIISASTTSEGLVKIQIDTVENAASWSVLAGLSESSSKQNEDVKDDKTKELWSAFRDNHALLKQKELAKKEREEKLKRERELAEELRRNEEIERKKALEEERLRKEKEAEEARLRHEQEIEEARMKAKRDREMKLKAEMDDDLSLGDNSFGMGSMGSMASILGDSQFLGSMMQQLKSPEINRVKKM